jgi:amino acid transporter
VDPDRTQSLWNQIYWQTDSSFVVPGLVSICPFALLTGIGLYQIFTKGGISPITPFVTAASDKSLGMVFAGSVSVLMWNYGGWDLTSTVAKSMANPRRDYPWSLFCAVGLVTSCYFLPSITALAIFGEHPGGSPEVWWADGTWSLAGAAIGGQWLGNLISVMAMVSAIGLYSAFVLVLSRVPFEMANDGYLPRILTKCNKQGVPWVSMVVTGIANTGIVLLYDEIYDLLDLEVSFYSSMVCLEILAFVVLRYREPILQRPFIVPGGWGGVCVICVSTFSVAVLRFSAMTIYNDKPEKAVRWWISLCLLASAPILFFVLRA